MSLPATLPRLEREGARFGRIGPEMQERLDPYEIAPELMQAMLELEQKVKKSGLDPGLIRLVKILASQLNGCAYCIDMHTRDARAAGESEQRLYLLSAWRESPLYSARERAALAWTESLTLLASTHAPDEVYAQLAREFSEAERVKLTMVIVAINGWNRIAVGFRKLHPLAGDRAAA
jgi:AhpD family alkylhydroperoxidase